MMKVKYLSKEWETLIGKDLPKIEVKMGDLDWILQLLGWKKEYQRSH